jgi:xylose isomerase
MALRDLRGQKTRKTPEELIKHLNNFSLDLQFTAGVWFFAPGGGRFHDRYVPDKTIKERLDIAAEMSKFGLKGVEAHYPKEVNEGNVDLYKDLEKNSGVRLVTVIPGLFYDAEFEWGSLSSPIPAVRKMAIDRTIAALKLNKELDTDFSIVWPGIDGYENGFGIDMMAARDRFAEGLAEAMDAVPGVRVAEEPKPYEPRGHILYGTTAEGMLLSQKVEDLLKNPENRAILDDGHAMVGLNPEVGHMLMGFEDLPYAFSLILEYGRLMHTHWNSQPLGNYDQDLNVGVLSPESLESALYILKMHGYSGYFGPDLNPERIPIKQALCNSFDAIRAANDRIDNLDHEKVIMSTSEPTKNRGWLEAYMIRQRAPQSAKLSPLPEFEK